MPPFFMPHALAAAALGGGASSVFYITLLFVFATAIVGTLVSRWKRDACLKFFRGYRVTLVRPRGRTVWGALRVLSSGIELAFDHAVTDGQGRQKRSFLVYQNELDPTVHLLLRHHDALDAEARRRREKQAQATFNPGFFRRAWRWVRNVINTLRDAFNQAIGLIVGQLAKTRGGVVGRESGNVTTIGQTLLGGAAPNAYEPLLEQYIGQPVILDVADPLDPNNAMRQFAGYLADYTSQFVAVFNVAHAADGQSQITLPPPAEVPCAADFPPPPPGAGADLKLPEPDVSGGDLQARACGGRVKLTSRAADRFALVTRLRRDGFEPLALDVVLPPGGTLDLPARDAGGAVLDVTWCRGVDVVAPRRLAVVRHAGKQLPSRSLLDDLGLDELPLVPRRDRETSAA